MGRKEDDHKYDDIIYLEHPTSRRHPRMPVADRAAQFSPFAALTGYDAAIKETARKTERRVELDEYEKAVLDERLRELAAHLDEQPVVTITYFQPDERKEGGAYLTTEGIVRKIDPFERCIVMMDGQKIPIEDISSL